VGPRSSFHRAASSVAAAHKPPINSVPLQDANAKKSAAASKALPAPQPKS
jgi:hypothetical protein